MSEAAKLIEALRPIIDAIAGVPDSIVDNKPAMRLPNDARSPGTVSLVSFGQLRAIAALASITPPPAVTLCAPVAGRNYRTRDGRKVAHIGRWSAGVFVGRVDGRSLNWNADGSFCANAAHPLDLVAEWTDEVVT